MDTERSRQILAEKIARDIFALGDEPRDMVQRIEFKGGEWPDRETCLGGLNERALAGVIASAIEKHRV